MLPVQGSSEEAVSISCPCGSHEHEDILQDCLLQQQEQQQYHYYPEQQPYQPEYQFYNELPSYQPDDEYAHGSQVPFRYESEAEFEDSFRLPSLFPPPPKDFAAAAAAATSSSMEECNDDQWFAQTIEDELVREQLNVMTRK